MPTERDTDRPIDLERLSFSAQEAKIMATAAHDLAKSVDGRLTDIARSIEGLRGENTNQHRETAKKIDEGFERVHARISSVKQTQDTDRQATSVQFGDLEKTVTASVGELRAEIATAKTEAKDGDNHIVSKGHQAAIAIMRYVIVVLVSILMGLLGWLLHSHFTITVPQ